MTTAAPAPTNGSPADMTAGCGLKPTHLPRSVTITVDGVVIARDAIARETQNHPAEKPVEAWLAAARALVVRELLLGEARRLAIAPCPIADEDGRRETDDEALVRQLIEQEVVTPDPDEAACRRVYEAHAARFRSSDLYGVRHILFAAAPDDEGARCAQRAAAAAVIAELTEAPDRFAALAEAHSACPSRLHGGQLGQIGRGQTVPEFEAALATAPVGVVCPDAVESRYGIHVVIVDQRLPGRQVPFDAVREQIAGWLEDRSRTTAIRQYIGLLAGRATIVGISLDQQSSPLVQ